jgi:hypothetical protein
MKATKNKSFERINIAREMPYSACRRIIRISSIRNSYCILDRGSQ